MSKIDLYIGLAFLRSAFLALLVIVGLDLVAAFIDELSKIQGNYTALEIPPYLFATLPGRIYEFMPFALLIGSLISLGQLSTNSELVVMRTAGVDLKEIVSAILKPVLVIALATLALGEFIAPFADLKAENRRAVLIDASKNKLSRYGVWSREGNTFVHYRMINDKGEARGVTIFKFDDQQSLTSVLRADKGHFELGHWLLFQVKRTDFFQWGTKGSSLDSFKWQTSITPRLLLLELVDARQHRISDLFYYSNYLNKQGLDAGIFELEFWRKICFPLTMLSLVFVGISFIFGPLREGSVGFRVFVGVMVGIVFRVGQDLIGPSSLVFGFSPMLAATLPILGCVVLGSFVIAKID